MREHSSAAGVIFTCLPPVPELLDNEQEGQVKANKFIKGLDILSGLYYMYILLIYAFLL